MNTVAAANPTEPIRCYVIKSSMGLFRDHAAALTQGCGDLALLQQAPYNCIALNDVSDPDLGGTGYSKVLTELGDPGELTSVGLSYIIGADGTLQASCSKDPSCVQAALEAAIGALPPSPSPAPTFSPDPRSHDREAADTGLLLGLGLSLGFILLCVGMLGYRLYEQLKHKQALAKQDGAATAELAP